MPLYACEHCGFTSAAFRNDAAAAHRVESPDCDDPIRIIFRSEDRYRGSAHATAPVAAQDTHERPAAANQPRRAFATREHPDLDGIVRLTLLGDLDLTTADTFRRRLAELKPSGRPRASGPLAADLHRQRRNPSPTRGAHRRPMDRMAARRRSAGQPHRGAGSPDRRDRPGPMAAQSGSEPKRRTITKADQLTPGATEPPPAPRPNAATRARANHRQSL